MENDLIERLREDDTTIISVLIDEQFEKYYNECNERLIAFIIEHFDAIINFGFKLKGRSKMIQERSLNIIRFKNEEIMKLYIKKTNLVKFILDFLSKMSLNSEDSIELFFEVLPDIILKRNGSLRSCFSHASFLHNIIDNCMNEHCFNFIEEIIEKGNESLIKYFNRAGLLELLVNKISNERGMYIFSKVLLLGCSIDEEFLPKKYINELFECLAKLDPVKIITLMYINSLALIALKYPEEDYKKRLELSVFSKLPEGQTAEYNMYHLMFKIRSALLRNKFDKKSLDDLFNKFVIKFKDSITTVLSYQIPRLISQLVENDLITCDNITELALYNISYSSNDNDIEYNILVDEILDIKEDIINETEEKLALSKMSSDRSKLYVLMRVFKILAYVLCAIIALLVVTYFVLTRYPQLLGIGVSTAEDIRSLLYLAIKDFASKK